MCSYAQNRLINLHSPNGENSISFQVDNMGKIYYNVSVDGQLVIMPSRLGIISNGENPGSRKWNVDDVTIMQVDTIWKPIWGKRSLVSDVYQECWIQLSDKTDSLRKLNMLARVYNDGIAFRYVVPIGSKICEKVVEQTEFHFAGNYVAWSYNGENHNLGPEFLTDIDGQRLPVMTVNASDSIYMAIHEADLKDCIPLKLKSSKGSCLFEVSSSEFDIYPEFESAWRVIFCANTPGKLVDSHLLELLNPAPVSDWDFSWVKPGMALWDWRINGAEWDGFVYTMSYPSWVKMVDFAAERGFAYLVLDANWYGPEFDQKSDPVKGEKAKDVQRLIQYAGVKKVGIWLYLNDVAGSNYSMEQTLEQYEKWGAVGIKYGFMTGTDIEKNRKTQEITEACARHKLLVDFHDHPVHPYGQMRTWPNAVTREYCKAQLDGHDIFYPKTFVTSVFVNMLAGPLDMNNGMFDLRQGKTTRVDNNMEVPSTVTSEAARTLITFSGVTILPDIPEYYRRYPALLRFLSAQQMPWLESITLDGRIGEYIVMMRQAQDGTYLLGAVTNESARVLQIPLSFLDSAKYEAEIIEDGDDAHYLYNRESNQVRILPVNRSDFLSVRLAPGGGACIRIVKK